MTIEQKFNTSYTGYNNVEYNNICLAMCFFNPLNYKTNLKNIKTVIQELKKTNIPFFVIELIYSGQSASIPEANYVVKGQSFYFSKENLWNILETKIPDKYEKIIFLDSDVLCTDPNWINRAAESLNNNKVIHASDYLYKDIYADNIYETVTLDAINGRHSIVKAIKNKKFIDHSIYHPGFNISINRNFFHEIGGIFDISPITIGDTLFWIAFVPNYRAYCGTFFCSPNFNEQRQKYFEYRKKILSLCDPNKEIDYLPNNHCLHLYHGTIKNRNYGKQFSFIPGPFTLEKNEYGVLEIEIKHPFVKDLKKYFEARNEDEPIT